jgi:uncharacterized damage-inducible protein DinB
MVHCEQFSLEEINREMDGFGIPSIRLQLYHMIAAEEYWIGVIKGAFDADDHDEDYPDLESLEKYRNSVMRISGDYLRTASEDELNSPRPMLTWQNEEQIMAPAHIIMRTQTHIFQHLGQTLAMCRVLGKPESWLAFPITP